MTDFSSIPTDGEICLMNINTLSVVDDMQSLFLLVQDIYCFDEDTVDHFTMLHFLKQLLDLVVSSAVHSSSLVYTSCIEYRVLQGFL